MTDDEVSYFVNAAVHRLIATGIITLAEQDKEQEIILPSITHNSTNMVN